MSRYPGTQFKVFDNSQATAIVPVTRANSADAVQYLTSFASVKGPEGITLISGNSFYDVYGTQDNIDFKKYGQPLFQASMNINNGASLLAKRVVFDDATLGNATVAISLTKYKDAKLEVNGELSGVDGLIKSIKFNKTTTRSRYSIAPIIFSIDNKKNYSFASYPVNEYKERYDLYKNHIIDTISNEKSPNTNFLHALGDNRTNILSGYTQSVYYDEYGKIVDLTSGDAAEKRSSVRNIKSITTGLYKGIQQTYSSRFHYTDITKAGTDKEGYTVDDSKEIFVDKPTTIEVTKDDGTTEQKTVTFGLFKAKVTPSTEYPDDAEKAKIEWIPCDDFDLTIKNIAKNIPTVDRIVVSHAEAEAILEANPDWKENGYISDDHNEYILITGPGSEINTSGYKDTIRLMNDYMVEESGYIECEYIFPMFTIFDNGRGESIKTIGIEYDAASSAVLKKAIYSLSVYNYETSKRLEKFSFSLNPYARNNNTGYTFDIESAVNYNSNQISVKTYYESYDALLETLQNILESKSDDIISTYDILFGHTLNGKYNAFNSYAASSLLKRYTYVYDYAHLDIFDNDILTINAYCDSDNMSSLNVDDNIKYYYYNYIRTQQRILEKLEFGSNGYCLSRTQPSEDELKKREYKVPFIVIDSDDKSCQEIMLLTGQPDGAIIEDENKDTGDIQNSGMVASNFYKVRLTLNKVKCYEEGNEVDGNYYLLYNKKTLLRNDVLNVNDPLPVGFNGYKFEALSNTKGIDIEIPYAEDFLIQMHYERFFSGEFDKDIFNLDIYFPNALFDANYSNKTKLAIQRLAAYRGDFMCYMDMGVGKVHSYTECSEIIPSTLSGLDLVNDDLSGYYYVRDMHIAVTCLSYKIRNPYNNKVIEVTATYGLSNIYVNHFANNAGNVFAGISNGVTIDNIIEGSVSYIPKIYPTSEMTSLNNIGGVYPSEDETIINEKQLMCDLRVNYGCYYDDRFSIETEYTMNPTESEFSYWNNVALVCLMMQSIRKACPAARYQFITADDLTVYQDAVETAIKPWRNKFAAVRFKYIQDESAIQNKIYYAAIEVVFKPFAQAEIFTLTALNYSTLSSTITTV